VKIFTGIAVDKRMNILITPPHYVHIISNLCTKHSTAIFCLSTEIQTWRIQKGSSADVSMDTAEQSIRQIRFTQNNPSLLKFRRFSTHVLTSLSDELKALKQRRRSI
jgi:hypothetical protein